MSVRFSPHPIPPPPRPPHLHPCNAPQQLRLAQEPDLFKTTVANNIAYGARKFGDAPVTREMIENAAKIANAHNFIMALPKGNRFSA